MATCGRRRSEAASRDCSPCCSCSLVFAGIGAAHCTGCRRRAAIVLPVAVTTARGANKTAPPCYFDQLVWPTARRRKREQAATRFGCDSPRSAKAHCSCNGRDSPRRCGGRAPAVCSPADAAGDCPRNRLTLSGTARRGAAAGKHKLLIPISASRRDPLFASPPGDLSAAVFLAARCRT